jgi:hypothetical protein
LKIEEITERLKKVRSEIENAFEKELIDFDEIENELSAVIDALLKGRKTAPAKDRFVPKMENYI